MTRTRSDVFDVLVERVLTVEACGDDRFLGTHPADSLGRVYGGEIAAQGLRAAAETVDRGLEPNSLHVSFLGIGDVAAPMLYAVRRLRDSRLFSTRLVTASQDERLVAIITVSMQRPRPGLEHQAMHAAPAPSPEGLSTRSELAAATFGADVPPSAAVPWPIDMRYADHAPWDTSTPGAGAHLSRLWVRGDGELGSDPVLHACVLTYASDLTMFEPVVAPHNPPDGPSMWERLSRGELHGATLDHSIWFHRPFRADDWLLHERESPTASGSRGFASGRFFTADGVLVASVAQEIAVLVDAPESRPTKDAR
jgi:acyl-CoA thioesterase-2